MSLRPWFSALALAALLGGGGLALAAGPETQPPQEIVSFGALRAMAPEEARGQVEVWLKGVGKADETTRQALKAIWAQEHLTLVDKVADGFALADESARRLLAEARDPAAPAPTRVPPIFKDAKLPAFYRANLALAYAKALAGRRVYEEALEVLRSTRPEQVVEPSTYLFHRAVAEHGLLLKPEATATLVRLLDDAADAPERYKMVGGLMLFDMMTWREKDLGWIARKMDNIERRLDLTRGGPQTQKMQKEVVARLDELIKQLENQQGGS